MNDWMMLHGHDKVKRRGGYGGTCSNYVKVSYRHTSAYLGRILLTALTLQPASSAVVRLLSEVVELLSVALRAVLALAAIAFCLFSSVVQVTFIIFLDRKGQ